MDQTSGPTTQQTISGQNTPKTVSKETKVTYNLEDIKNWANTQCKAEFGQLPSSGSIKHEKFDHSHYWTKTVGTRINIGNMTSNIWTQRVWAYVEDTDHSVFFGSDIDKSSKIKLSRVKVLQVHFVEPFANVYKEKTKTFYIRLKAMVLYYFLAKKLISSIHTYNGFLDDFKRSCIAFSTQHTVTQMSGPQGTPQKASKQISDIDTRHLKDTEVLSVIRNLVATPTFLSGKGSSLNHLGPTPKRKRSPTEDDGATAKRLATDSNVSSESQFEKLKKDLRKEWENENEDFKAENVLMKSHLEHLEYAYEEKNSEILTLKRVNQQLEKKAITLESQLLAEKEKKSEVLTLKQANQQLEQTVKSLKNRLMAQQESNELWQKEKLSLEQQVINLKKMKSEILKIASA